MPNRPIYLDYQATTPVDEAVLAAMLPYFREDFGNAHAEENGHGQRAAAAVAEARRKVAALVGAAPKGVIFTSGATEANNLLIRGAAARQAANGRPHVITTSIEHKAVLEVVRRLGQEGHPVTILDVDTDGLLDPALLTAAVSERTGLVSVMAANNEIGVLQPLERLGAIAREAGALFHTDATQALGKVELDLGTMNVDLMSVSAHKIYGPQGIGAAIATPRALRLIEPLFAGGSQEAGVRPGTVPLPLCVGFGAACALARETMAAEEERIRGLAALFLELLAEAGVDYALNGSRNARLAGNLNLSFPGCDAEAILMVTRDLLSLSTGSACTSGSLDPSHVLKAIGLGPERSESALRISLGRPTTEQQVREAAEILTRAVHQLRQLSYAPPAAAAGGLG